MYQNLIFDLYGTLIDIETNEDQTELWEQMAKLYSCFGATYNAEELRNQYICFCKKEAASMTGDYCEICLDSVFANLFVDKGILPESSLVYYIGNTFRVLSRSVFSLYPGTIELLKQMKEAGKKIYLLSNAQRIFTYQELVESGLIPYFDGIFISSDHGIKKPNPAYLEKLISTYKLKREECIMIGNEIASDIQIANACGIDSIYLRTQTFEALPEKIPATHILLEPTMQKLGNLLS